MYFKQFYLGCLAHASYLVADEESGVAAVIDPQRDIDVYLREAQRRGLRIEHVFLTHFHADFVAGHLELRDRVGARIRLSARAKADFDFAPVEEGDRLELGSVRLEFLSTPGHTDEAISILVFDTTRDSQHPYAVLTGDTLFIGDVGRPDLLASIGVSAGELGSMLYDSLHEKLLKLPDETLVYPAHGAGSLCGKQLSEERVSTIGEQRRSNYALQPMSREEFVQLVTADQPEAPPYFAYDAALNRQERPLLDDVLARELEPLTIEALLAQRNAGAQLVDTREPAEFAAGHLSGSLNIPLSGRYATWAGFLLERERPIVLVTEPGNEREAASRLGRIGYDFVRGYLAPGASALDARPDLIERVQRVSPRHVLDLLISLRPVVLDVRTEAEWTQGHVEGSVNIPLQQLRGRMAELDPQRALVVHCKSGMRSSMAVGLLQSAGFPRLFDLEGGIDAWSEAGLERVTQGTNASV